MLFKFKILYFFLKFFCIFFLGMCGLTFTFYGIFIYIYIFSFSFNSTKVKKGFCCCCLLVFLFFLSIIWTKYGIFYGLKCGNVVYTGECYWGAKNNVHSHHCCWLQWPEAIYLSYSWCLEVNCVFYLLLSDEFICYW